jgi:serine protease inhibitor
VPVYRVFCGPDGESARAIYDILFHHPEKIREEAEEMKVKDGFVLRNVVDEYIVMPTGDNIAKFDGAVVLNEVSAFVFEQMKRPVSREDLLEAVLNEFEVDEATAKADLDALLEKLTEMGLIEA